MTRDLYAYYGCSSKDDIKKIVMDGKLNPYTKIQLLSLATEGIKELTRVHYQQIVHQEKSSDNQFTNRIISSHLKILNSLYQVKSDNTMAIQGSFFIEFNFTLAKPFLSKDDTSFYVIDNPVRKDKVFKVPTIPSASWKGNLRWTMMRIFLHDSEAHLSPDGFAKERMRQSLLFGTEKGMEEGRAKAWTKYLDDIRPDAASIYRNILKAHFGLKIQDPEPHFTGRLHFYPTFLDAIDLMVINPHDRKRKTGRNPIYIECVPSGAKGNFRLFYIPYDLFSRDTTELYKTACEDLKAIAMGLKEMFLTYGFSAKKTSGFGVVDDKDLNGIFSINLENSLSRPFGNFRELIQAIEKTHV
jgi:CRISPR-associated protein Cmr2